MAISTPMLVTFLVYIFGMILIGFLAWRSTKNFDDYILGGRSLGPMVTALSAGASDMSGWLLMGLPGAIFISGISESWIAIGLTLGAWINWKLVAGRLRVHTEVNNNALTLPDYFTGRFEDNSRILRIISAVVILLFFTIYCASGIVAGARLFESTFGMSYETALWAGAAATILYTFVGGFLAVSWTDTVQASLMIFALILTPVIVIFTVGGFGESLEVIKQKSIENVGMLKGLNFVAIVSLMGWGLGYFGMPHILVRFMAIRHEDELKISRRIASIWVVISMAVAVFIGIVGHAVSSVGRIPMLEGSATETVIVRLSDLLSSYGLLPAIVAGCILAGILAATMSTADSQLLAAASAFSENVLQDVFGVKLTSKQNMLAARLTVVVIAFIAIFLAADPNSNVFKIVSFAWAGFGATFGPAVLFALFWRRSNRQGVLAGLVAGGLMIFAWKFCVRPLGGIWDIYELMPAFVVNCIVLVVVSLATPAPDKSITDVFDKVRN